MRLVVLEHRGRLPEQQRASGRPIPTIGWLFGPATAGPGVTGKLSVLTRSDGSVQAAYDGHPLYTYVGDSAPGQTSPWTPAATR